MKYVSQLCISLFFILATISSSLASANSSLNGDLVQLTLANGQTARAYVSGPKDAAASLLVVHDWFGITEATKTAISHLNNLGYRTLAVDLYNGQSASTHDAANKLMSNRNPKVTQAILQAGLDYLKQPDRKTLTLGFSMGAIEALRANLNDPSSVKGTIMVYGFGFDGLASEQLARLESPVLTITGSLDAGSVQSSVNFLAQAKNLEKVYEMYIYPNADHAYAQPLFNEGKNVNAEATRVTWLLIDDFLKRHAPLELQK